MAHNQSAWLLHRFPISCFLKAHASSRNVRHRAIRFAGRPRRSGASRGSWGTLTPHVRGSRGNPRTALTQAGHAGRRSEAPWFLRRRVWGVRCPLALLLTAASPVRDFPGPLIMGAPQLSPTRPSTPPEDALPPGLLVHGPAETRRQVAAAGPARPPAPRFSSLVSLQATGPPAQLPPAPTGRGLGSSGPKEASFHPRRAPAVGSRQSLTRGGHSEGGNLTPDPLELLPFVPLIFFTRGYFFH